ncbi:hypothetical protein O6H91_01G139500 [Diphasiastrum complanatum]|uniref:Uncharacterized protein n=5 Tax=Diphasiastrum complanatum TaxID=34168 RepID=A0ACC2EWN2_DIPCM|nr:hypothetical protein O6H91_01G139500 [Diphasiastrum complanatum]KAJ7570908.1 hypothetical protein O6H91_01G139500 [Diphasiastrum complanatum]KAJ7570909.1 hypothetical protein O6H91_01G139500 [Diphasiastrum complanatum]KAJ7570910.1 hypothetical protein O6H91_01G139500 [Diphasiastrum complanatum]KAJ7570911.1 hypothetical protein O6H91_01G139500 [Diphasiastrum complanatum]
MSSTVVAHAVIVPFPFHGHILPALSLARVLAAKGLFVTFVLSQHRITGPRSAASHLCSLQNSIPSFFRLVAIPDPLQSHDLVCGVDEGLESATAEVERSQLMQQPFERLMDDLMAADGFPGPPVCIISDAWLSWTQEIADKFHILRYVFYPSQPTVLAPLFYVPVLQAQGRLPLKASRAPDDVEACDEEHLVRIPNMPPLRNLDCNSLLLETYRKSLHDAFIRNWIIVHKAAGVLINSFYELDTLPIDALRNRTLNPSNVDILTVGPLHSSATFVYPASEATEGRNVVSQEEKQCLKWLDNQSTSSVLYISFGTIFLPSLAQIHEIALGLEASEQSFLWMLRPPAGILCPLQEFDGSTILPEGFLSRIQRRGLIIVNWAPQKLILSHPSTGAFFTHCGWNSTLESICMGVPTVAFPQFADQRTNCNLLVNQLKVGLEPHRQADGLIERGEVERVARIMLTRTEGIEMRSRAKQWSTAAFKAVEKGGSSDRNLESFAMKMKQLCFKTWKLSN